MNKKKKNVNKKHRKNQQRVKTLNAESLKKAKPVSKKEKEVPEVVNNQTKTTKKAGTKKTAEKKTTKKKTAEKK